MGILFDLMKSFLPRESYTPNLQVHIPKGNTKDYCKYFKGGPETYIFDFVCFTNSAFVFKIGKAYSNKDPKFNGECTPRFRIEGKGTKKAWKLTGKKFKMNPNDLWLIKIRLERPAPKGANSCQIFCETKS